MAAPKPIRIVGGGLAGLTLGIGLRQHNIPVTIFEAGHYPRHRVCGEFINGLGQTTLRRLGLIPLLQQAGAREIRNVSFGNRRAASRAKLLPQAGLAISRFDLDAALARRFSELGGELREQSRWTGDTRAEGIVLASGRRLQRSESGWRWFGLKVHARNIPLAADLEMHFLPDGYVGICKLSETTANICGLFRRRADASAGARDWETILRGASDSILHTRLKDAAFASDSFCSVAGLGLKPQRASHSDDCRIGDALTMTPPVTGNGMSMAFESAETALEPLTAFSRGDIPWSAAQKLVAKRCDARFSARLSWASAFHKLLFSASFRNIVPALPRVPFLWQFVVTHTR